METSEALPSGAVTLSDLADLVAAPGPFLTLLLVTEQDIENAAQRSEVRWKTVRSDLDDRRIPKEVLSAIDPLVPDAHLAGDGLFVVADAGGVRHVEHGPLPGPVDRAWWEPVPRLGTVVRWRQASVPFVVALADRTGATLYGFRRGPDDTPDLERDVEGDDYPIRKVHPGGWSQRRYQDRAENTWEENAEDVAQAIARMTSRIGARLVLLGGDVRATTLIQESWPAGFELPVEIVPGERPWEGSGPTVPDEAQEIVDRFVEGETAAIVGRFREEKGQQDLAAEGAPATIAALAASQVAVLLLHDVPEPNDDEDADEPTAWVGPNPMQIATTRDDLEGLGIDPAIEVPRSDALIRAAIATSAAIRLVPVETGLRDGVGALLRWST
ncbi:MAG: baeRF2 domain-containing protein [Actinomycetota bacterium]